MTEMEDYLGRVHGLVIAVADDLTHDQYQEVSHLIEHGEPAEGLRSLAWIISEEGLTVDRLIVSGIRSLTEGLIDPEDLPADLDDHVRV
jgi:hypothetical protein